MTAPGRFPASSLALLLLLAAPGQPAAADGTAAALAQDIATPPQSAPAAPKAANPVATVPLAQGTPLLVVWAYVNAKGPYLFAVDTGAASVFLDEQTAKALDLAPGKEISAQGSGGAFSARRTGEISLHLGTGVTLKAQQATVAPLGPIRDMMPAPGISGILGYELFARYTVEIDREKNVLNLYEPGTYPPPADAASLPLTLVGERMPLVRASVGIGKEKQEYVGTFLLDTGFNASVFLNQAFFRRYPVRKDTRSLLPSHSGLGGVGVAGKLSPDGIARLNSFSLGEHTFREPLVVLAGSPDPPGAAKMGIDGLIGGALLSRLHAVVDYSARRLYLRPNSSFSDPFLLFRYGWLLEPDGAGLVVRDVQAKSPAAKAGLRKGDRIVKVEDAPDLRLVSPIPINGYSLPGWSPTVERTWKLDVVRGKESITLTFQPESL